MELTVSDWVGIAQAAVLLLTAIVIVWYTIETHRIRKETTKQSKEASNQTALLSEQLLLLRKQLELDISEQLSSIEPILKLEGGS